MDANKLQVLQDIGYVVRDSCGSCINFDPGVASGWGVCTFHSYDHIKHTGVARQLSVNEAGWCPWFERDREDTALLGAYQQFME